jgi:hypothetical protein
MLINSVTLTPARQVSWVLNLGASGQCVEWLPEFNLGQFVDPCHKLTG